ncbi:esterase FE4-like isoform X1 [Ostrinia furnacalis]|uniref:esterase FE4-like isoform X1 n=1 Tax=Ostrinia furnacalis TaxID=93504 RepID=UPI00103C5410|nr:esterase FE4-like isoform X1 [Ostrinia furnacalis]
MTKTIPIFVLLGVILVNVCAGKETVEVKLKQGLVSGKEHKTFLSGKPYYAFKGIPYAAPPVGELRFKPPKAPQDWGNELLEAYTDKPTCVQFCSRSRNSEPYGISGSEDCLYVNIFTPNLEGSAAVLVFDFHDNFRTGFNGTKTYAPEFLPEENVVIVTVSHRLGLLGYLTTEDDVIPPNNGIKDFIFALKWVKDNIKSFGGDPNRVTIMGSKGGAVMANILLYSEQAKGLFNSVIIQGSSAHEAIFFPRNPRKSAFQIAELLNIETDDSTTLLKELQNLDHVKILENEVEVVDDEFYEKYQMSIHPFGPVIEKEGPEAVLTTLPENGKIVNDVPVLIGFNSREGLDLISRYLFNPRSLTDNSQDFFIHFPIRADYRFDRNNSAFEQYKEEVVEFYFKDGVITYSTLLEYADYVGDVLQNYAMNAAARKISSDIKSPTFYYMFDFNGLINENWLYVAKYSRSIPLGNYGASVADELCYLHLCSRIKRKYVELKKLVSEQNEMKVLKKMIRMWANFAKTGNPTPDEKDNVLKNFKWQPIDKDSTDLAYAHIKKTLNMAVNPLGKRETFWDTTLNKYLQMAVDGVAQKVDVEKDEL